MTFIFSFSLNIFSLGLVLVFFFLAHVFKFMRFWLVLMEEKKLSLFDVFFLYVRTTFVNLIIPFKIGEIFRIAAVRHMTGALKTGILLVVVDRFFDTLALIMLTLPFEILFGNGADPVLTVLFGGLIILFILYLFYAPSYRYMNKYLIMNRRSARSMLILDALDRTYEWYGFLRKLVRGRSPMILIASLFGWVMEFAAFKFLSGAFGSTFGIEAFITYINSILSGGKSRIGSIYNTMGIIIFAILTVVMIILLKTGNKGKENAIRPETGGKGRTVAR